MKLDLNKFYNTNYKDFVHKEAVEEALKRVPELELKDVEVENILSLTFSVDPHGENPMYVEYLDKEGKKHIVRIRPAVTEEIIEILKNYETKEEHQADVENIYNYFETLNVPMEIRSANGLDEEGNREVVLNNDNSFISFQVDPEQDDAIQWLCIQNKNGSLGSQYQYMARFVDYAKVDQVPSNAEFLEKIQQLEELIQRKSQETLQNSKEYTDSNISSLANELNVKVEQTKNDLTVLIDEKAGDTLQQAKEYADSKDTEYFETGKRYADNVKQEAVDESKNYTNTKHDEALTIIEPCQQKLSNIWQSHKAPFIYWLPNIDVNTMKLENKENDVKVTLNDGDVVYWRKNAYQPVDLSNYYTKTESDEKYATKGEVVKQEDFNAIINPITDLVGRLEQNVDTNASKINSLLEWKLEVDAKLSPQTTTTITKVNLYNNEINAYVGSTLNKIPVTPTLNRLIIYDNDNETWYNGHLEITLNTAQTLSLSITTFDILLTDDFFSPENSYLMFATADYSDNLAHYISTSFSSFDSLNTYRPLFRGIRSYAKKGTDIMTEQKISLSFIVRRIKK